MQANHVPIRDTGLERAPEMIGTLK